MWGVKSVCAGQELHFRGERGEGRGGLACAVGDAEMGVTEVAYSQCGELEGDAGLRAGGEGGLHVRWTTQRWVSQRWVSVG